MRHANWQIIEKPKLLDFEPPLSLQESVRAVGKALLAHGVGHASFDFMRSSTGFRLIEANTCAVSTAAWNLNPDRCATRLAEALIQTLQRPQAVPEYRWLRDQARGAGNDQSAVKLQEQSENSHEDRVSPSGTVHQPPPPSAEQLFYKRLTETERLPPARLAPFWRGPAEMLLKHAFQTVPFYRDRLARIFDWSGRVDWNRWASIPPTRRHDVRNYRSALLSRSIPPMHGATAFGQTSGTTDEPIAVTYTVMHAAVESCLQARLYQWHGVHPASAMATFAGSKPLGPDGNRTWAPQWLRLPHGLDHAGNCSATPEEQLRWLTAGGPAYLRTRPSIARSLALAVARTPALRPNLKGILTQGEIVTQDHRRLCRQYLGHDLIDAYGLAETGLIAFQCPVADVYHAQIEACIFEVVDAAGRLCEPGQTGEIIVTPLYNFAMPLIRYATGDFAEMPDHLSDRAGPCSCGRTLPAIKRVMGRRRNFLCLPSGLPFQPNLDSRQLLEFLGANEWQVAQTGPREVELRYASHQPEERENREALVRYLCRAIRADVSVRFRRMEHIPLLGGKREDILALQQPEEL